MKEQVSAMMDGELADHECEGCAQRIKDDPQLRQETWDLYHLIGDALRGHLVPGVIDQVRAQLAAEPPILAPRRAAARPARRAAWYALSAAATVVAVAFVGWTALPRFDLPSGRTEIKVAAAPAPASAAPAAGFNDYLLAHQRFSPSAMGGIAPYVRTVAEENGAH